MWSLTSTVAVWHDVVFDVDCGNYFSSDSKMSQFKFCSVTSKALMRLNAHLSGCHLCFVSGPTGNDFQYVLIGSL
jgi:hypothetical protein